MGLDAHRETADQEYVVPLAAVRAADRSRVGGKAASLGELMRLEGVRVPDGLVVTTAAFAHARHHGWALPPDPVDAAITAALARYDADARFAVRSSATLEDSADASFAGQHDSLLEVPRDEVPTAVRQIWASLATERAAAYRAQHGIDDAAVAMAVVVQLMVEPIAAGVLFTADPVSGDRRTCTIEAVAGLGDALVSGTAHPEAYRVRDGVLATQASGPEAALLAASRACELARLGRQIEAAFGAPQDIEWCLDASGFAIVQSRPITGLYPVPTAAADGAPHLYVSVGHQQMMTDAMRPLGLSVWQQFAVPPMHEAGGRLFVDAAPMLASPAREAVIRVLGEHEPLLRDALETVLARGDFPPGAPAAPPTPEAAARAALVDAPEPIPNDPAIVAELIANAEARRAEFAAAIRGVEGVDALELVRADIAARKTDLFKPRAREAVMAGMDASAWLSAHLLEWLGEVNVADAFTRSAPGNVTSEMGLALLDVADAIRPHAAAVRFLEQAAAELGELRGTGAGTAGDRRAAVAGPAVLDRLERVAGGAEARAASDRFLAHYGMRCVGEIDVTRTRWAERPAELFPLILANVHGAGPGESARRFARGQREAQATTHHVLTRLRALPGGEAKAAEAAHMIERVRTFIGYREYPKYDIVCRAFAYKQVLAAEIERLVDAGTLADPEDADFLTFDELVDAVRTGAADPDLIEARRATFAADERRTPPRLLTGDGEIVTGRYRRDNLPVGALAGLAVSRGTVEGRARVVHDVKDAVLEPGDILVTTFTDPGWSAAFVAAAGLVTEIGGTMTHGAVIAREYGLPAVVGVERATAVIRDGQRIRVHGTDGYVELLDA